MPLTIVKGTPVRFAQVPKCAGSSVEGALKPAFGRPALLSVRP